MIDSKSLIKQYGLNPNKALGQNFLVDENALARIVELSECEGENVLEIGPGLGVLTNELANSANKVVCVEIDAKMCELLSYTLNKYSNVSILNSDILKVKNETLRDMLGSEFVVAANLPYYITSQTAMKLIDSELPIKRMVLMMQQEASEHFVSSPKQKCYTPVSVIAQRYFKITHALKLPPSCYYPEPAVHSCVLVFERNNEEYDPAFSKLVKAAFAMRRKTLQNNLAAVFGKSDSPLIIAKAELEPSCRAEELTVDEFARLVNASRAL